MSKVRVYQAAVTNPAASRVRVYQAGVTAAGASRVRVYQAAVTATVSLVANAGPDQSVKGLDRVVLDGSASTGNITTWEWSQAPGDAHPVTIDNPDQRYASFTAPGIAETGAAVTVRLRVSADGGATWSAYSTSTVTVARHRRFRSVAPTGSVPYRSLRTPIAIGNLPPVAVIGADQTVNLGDTVTIGGNDYDPDGSVIDVEFTWLSGPAKPALNGSGGFRTLTPTVAGTYVYAKRALDDLGRWSTPVQCTITVMPPDFILGTTKPTADNTGYSWTGAPLVKVVNGDLTITVPGLYEGYDVKGFIRIRTSGVTFRNSRGRGRNVGNDGQNRSLLFVDAGLSNVLVENVELYYEPAVGLTSDADLTACGAYNVDGLKMASGTARRVHVHRVSDTALIYGTAVQLEGIYCDDNIHLTVDPNHPDGSHDDGLQIQGGDGHGVYGCNIRGGYNAGVMVTQDVAPTTNLTIQKTWMGRGGATLNISEKGRGPLTGLRVVDNPFYADSRLAGFDILIPSTTRAIATITGNTRPDGSPAQIHNG